MVVHILHIKCLIIKCVYVNNGLRLLTGLLIQNPRSKHLNPPIWLVMRAFEPQHEISNNVVCATSKASDQPTLAHRLIRVFASRLNIL